MAERGKGLHAAECISLRQGTVDRIVSMILVCAARLVLTEALRALHL